MPLVGHSNDNHGFSVNANVMLSFDNKVSSNIFQMTKKFRRSWLDQPGSLVQASLFCLFKCYWNINSAAIWKLKVKRECFIGNWWLWTVSNVYLIACLITVHFVKSSRTIDSVAVTITKLKFAFNMVMKWICFGAAPWLTVRTIQCYARVIQSPLKNLSHVAFFEALK